MHRQRTKLVERTARATKRLGHGEGLVRRAKALEHKGIITTYKLHDRAFANRSARRRFDRRPPELDETQRRVLADLEQRDYALLPLADLVGEDTVAAVLAEGEQFVTEASQAESRDDAKDYLVRRYGNGDELPAGSAWLDAVLSDRLLGLASAYLRMWPKLEYVDFWYSVPVPADSDRILSQRWHRDFDDGHLLKAFVYLVDVDAETGPLEFVAGSARGGKLADFYPWYPLSPAYPSQAEFESAVEPNNVKTFTAPAGTLLLCNTSGFHRGGFATAKPRVLATATYCSPASLKSLTERNYRLPAALERSLAEPQRYAVG
jgi:hypothetical protein